MCYQLCEVYSACRCSYYIHAIDQCAAYGKPGHGVESRTITVGYACPEHSGAAPGSAPQEDDDDIFSDTESVFSDVSKASSGISQPSNTGEDLFELLFRDLLLEAQMQHLLPQLVRVSKSPHVAERNIDRLLKRFSQDLRAHSETVQEFQAAKYVRQARKNITRRIVECHSVELEPEGLWVISEVSHHGLADHYWFWGHSPADEDRAETQSDTQAQPSELVYDALIGFLFHGPPFESFRESMKEFIERSGTQPVRPLHSELANGRNFLRALKDRSRRPKPGRERFWWTCICGQKLYDDYEELRFGAFEDLKAFLSTYSRSTPLSDPALQGTQLNDLKVLNSLTFFSVPFLFVISVSSSGFFPWIGSAFRGDGDDVIWVALPTVLYCLSAVALLWSVCFVLILLRRTQSQADQGSGHADLSAEEEGRSHPSRENNQAPPDLILRVRKNVSSKDPEEPDFSECPTRNALPGDEQRHRFLLLCIPFMRWGLKLQQPDVCRIHSDRDFFRLLRKAYVEYRKGKRWKWVRQIQQLDFSQFELYHDSLVDIKATPSMPSVEARHEYDYEPPDTNPPIGPNLCMHLLQNPDHAPVLPILVRRVPIRRKSRLEPCPTKGFSAGWGINFIEGVDGWASFFCGFVGFILCLVTAIVWTVVKDDVQGGFGIGAFILAFSLFCSAKLHLLL